MLQGMHGAWPPAARLELLLLWYAASMMALNLFVLVQGNRCLLVAALLVIAGYAAAAGAGADIWVLLLSANLQHAAVTLNDDPRNSSYSAIHHFDLLLAFLALFSCSCPDAGQGLPAGV